MLLFTKKNKKQECDHKYKTIKLPSGYWWPLIDWTNRIKYLKWLLEQYKDDKTNLKEL